MEALLLLLYLAATGFAVVVWVGLRRAKERATWNRTRNEQLRNELHATRAAFLGRIEKLEQELAERQSAEGAKPGPAAAEKAPAAAGPPETAAPDRVLDRAAVSAPADVSGLERPSSEPGSEPGQADEAEAVPAPPGQGPPSEPPVPPAAPPPASPPAAGIDWEQWVGVRGAAVLGGIVMALAAIMFLRYTIEHDLIPPIVRVTLGFAAGLGVIGASEQLRKRGYAWTANALAGGGIVILYTSTWAARALYELIGAGLGFGLMVLITAACGALSWRHRARLVAVLGLAGGFATPILMSTGRDNPIGLFGYVLLLDMGLLWLGRARRWPWLMAMALLGTVFYEAGWVFGRMGPGRTLTGLVILGLFGLFFAFASRLQTTGSGSGEPDLTWRLSQAGGVLAPFVLALYFAGNSNLGVHLYPVAILLVILSAAACWLGRLQQMPLMATGAAAGSLGVVAVWLLRTRFTEALAWEASGICVALALVFHVFVELEQRRPAAGEAGLAAGRAMIASGGFLALLVLASVGEATPFWPWLAGWSALAALLVRQSAARGAGWLQAAASFGLGVGFSVFYFSHYTSSVFPAEALYFALVVVAALVFQLLAMRRGGTGGVGGGMSMAEIGAAVLPVTVLTFLVGESLDPHLAPMLYLATTMVLAFLVVLSATRMRSGGLYFAATLLLAFNHWIWTSESPWLWDRPETTVLALGLEFLAVVALSYWPFFAGRRLVGERWALYGAALAAPVWFFALRQLFEARFGDAAIGLLPVVLGVVSLGAAMKARQLGRPGDPERLRALAWFAAVALGFVSVAIPLQLDKQWITLGWALQGFAVTALWRRLDHPGLKYFGLALLGAVTIRLVANPELLLYQERSGWPIFNWLMYTYLVPAAALLGAARNLNGLEAERRRPAENFIYRGGYSAGAIVCVMAAIAVVFAWINLTIFDFYSTSRMLTISFERMAARDLTLSLAWALYALLLLGIGFGRKSVGLRWISLAFLLLTIGKVFLYDLGELEDLYRVASLVGLALSLILVSLAYQRFVFGAQGSKEGP